MSAMGASLTPNVSRPRTVRLAAVMLAVGPPIKSSGALALIVAKLPPDARDWWNEVSSLSKARKCFVVATEDETTLDRAAQPHQQHTLQCDETLAAREEVFAEARASMREK
jgi:hypothetical protein